LTLEGAERSTHRPFGRIVDQHDREQELIPRPDRQEDCERRERGPSQGDVHLPEELPRRRAVDTRGLRKLFWHVQEVGAHPEDAERHEQAD
jgi:hypothetical protein